MKRSFILLSLIAFLMQCSALQLMGQEIATWESGNLNLADGTPVTDPFAIGDYVQGQLAKALGSQPPAYYVSTDNVRLYAKNTVTIKALNGASISKVEFTFKKNPKKPYALATLTAPSYGTWDDIAPEYVSNNDTVVSTWEGALKDSLIVTLGNSGQRFLIKIVVTYSPSENTVSSVTYKPNGGVGDDVVVSAVNGTTMTVMENPFYLDEFVFDNWNTQANGQGVEYIPGTTFSLENDIVLYAQWTTSSDLFVDVINPTNVNAAIGNTTGYNNWELSFPNTGQPRVTYKGKSLKDNNYIQMNSSISGSSAYSGIVTSFTNNLKAKKVKVTWSGASSDGCTLLVYGKDTPYSGTSDLYGDTHGTLLGSIVKGTSTEFDIPALDGIYPYIGLRSSSGAIYLTEIRIIWETLDNTVPVIRIEPNEVNLGNVVINNPLSVNFTVSQANLTSGITLVTYPTAGIGTFSVNGTTVTTIAAGAPTVVTWTYTPTTIGDFDVAIQATSQVTSGTVTGELAIKATVLSADAQTLNVSKAAFVANSSQNSACINLDGVEVIAQSGNYLYLQDAVAGLLVYGAGAPNFETPCKFTSGYLLGTYTDYHGIIELINFSFESSPETTTDMELTTIPATVDQILELPSTYDSRYVQLENVYISNWTLSGNNGTLAFHDRFQTGYASKTAPEATDAFTVKGLVNGYYSSGATNYQIDPIALADIHTDMPAPQPTIDPTGTEANPSQATTVRVGPPFGVQGYAVYYYKINDGEYIPFTTWTHINLVNPQTTLQAYGTRDFYSNSEVKTSYYKLPQNVHAVRFSINGVVNESNNALVTDKLTSNQVPSVTCLGDFGFAGWSRSENSTETITFPYTVDEDITLYAVYAKGSNFVYKKVTNVSEIVDGEYVIFAEGNTDRYTIKNVSSTHSPTAYGMNSLGISISNQGTLVGGDMSELTWTFRGTASELQITSTANETNHLYIIGNISTGVRVGQTSGNTSWRINEDQSVVEQFNMRSNNRYLVVYNNQDWRSYLNMADGAARMLLFRKQAVIDSNAPRFTRVFWNETATRDILLGGPSVVPSGYYLDMTDDYTMTNDVSANFIIEDGASFKLANDNTGIKATVKKDIVGYVYDTVRTGWHLLSSPVGAFSTDSDRVPVGLLTEDYDLYAFNQSLAKEWQNNEDPNVVVSFGEQGGVLYASKANTTITFEGELTATPSQPYLVYDADARLCGWNLIGNPYTCQGYLTVQGESEAAAITDYYKLQDVSENGKKFSKLIATSIDTPVSSMEGVFVQAPAAGYKYQFVNSSPVVPNAGFINIMVSGSDGEVMDMARVRFNQGGLLGKFSIGEGGSELYIPVGGKNYAVVPSQHQGELPLNFKAAEDGEYTIAVDLGKAEMNYLHLIDNMTGADINLLETPDYTFEAKTGDYASRFRLVFNANVTEPEEGPTQSFAYFNGSSWVVTGLEADAILQVVDMMGRVIVSKDAKTGVSANEMSQGLYVLRLISGDTVKTQKIINK